MPEQTTVTYSLETILKEINSNQKETNSRLEGYQLKTRHLWKGRGDGEN